MPLLKHTKTMKKFGDLKNGDKLYITDPTGKTEICPILSVIAEKRDVFPWVHIAYADSNLNVKCFSVCSCSYSITEFFGFYKEALNQEIKN